MSPLLLAYVGPEAALPLLSVLAAIAGAFLIGWRWIAAFFRRIVRFVLRRGPPEAPAAPAAADADAVVDPGAAARVPPARSEDG